MKKRPYKRRRTTTSGSPTGYIGGILPPSFTSLAQKYKAKAKKCLFCKKPIYGRRVNTLYHKKCYGKAAYRQKRKEEGKPPVREGTRRPGL